MPTPINRRLAGAIAGVICIACAHPADGQRRQVHAYDVWVGTSGEQPVVRGWAGSLSVEHRRSNSGAVPRQMNFTGTVLREIGSGRRFGFGVAHYHTSPNDHIGPSRPQNERRIFEQLSASHRLLDSQWNHRFRYEQRWVGADPVAGAERDWVYTSRVRHQIRVIRPLDGHTTGATRLYAMPSVEGFVRTTDRRGVLFEQIRAGVGLGVGVASRINVEAGYVRQMTIRTDEVREVHDVVQVAARILGHARR